MCALPKQYRLLSEMVPSLSRLRAVHVKDCTINNRKTASELTKMWDVDKDWVSQFKAIHVPHTRVRYLGAVITIYAGTNYLAYDSKGILWAFGIEPKIIKIGAEYSIHSGKSGARDCIALGWRWIAHAAQPRLLVICHPAQAIQKAPTSLAPLGRRQAQPGLGAVQGWRCRLEKWPDRLQ